MLTICDGLGRINRRRLLTIGALGLGGLALPSLLSKGRAAERSKHVSGKSVIYLFQQGGPSQHETFDPKIEVPEAVRTVTGSTQTNVPGVHFGSRMSQLAKLADKLTVVRSFQTNNGGHNIQPIVGPDSLDTNIGVHYSRIVGATRAETGAPTNAVLYPVAIDPEAPGPSARGNLASTGAYGNSYAPFSPGGKGQLQQDMRLNLPKGRFFDDRRAILTQLDTINRKIDASGELETMDELQRQAYEVLLSGGVAKALDLSLEDPQSLARYDTAGYATDGRWDHKSRGKRGYYDAQARTIGKLLCLARRLCEAGAGFVTVHASYAGVWDMHADGNNLDMTEGMEAVGASFDHAVAAFVRDLEARGLENDIMLVCSGEMGRTPKINRRGGRDHWSRLAPLLIYGGGAEPQMLGQSTRDGGEPATKNFTPKHLISSIMNTVFDVGELRLVSGVPPEIAKLGQEEMIPVFGW